MKGIQRVRVSNRDVSYEFELKRKITVINGNSATGKSTLISLIADAKENRGAILDCGYPCRVLSNMEEWDLILQNIHESIVFIEEDFNYFKSDLFAEIVKNSSNYYVLICRDSIPSLAYSYKEIYEIHTSGKYHTLRQRYTIPDEIIEANYIYQMAKKRCTCYKKN